MQTALHRQKTIGWIWDGQKWCNVASAEVVERGTYSGDAGWGGKQKKNKGGRASVSSRFQFGKNKKKEADPIPPVPGVPNPIKKLFFGDKED